MTKRRGLGRGLDALIPETSATVRADDEKETKQIEKNVVADDIVQEKQPAQNSEKKTKTTNEVKASGLPQADDGDIISMRLTKIEPNRHQPRKAFDRESLEELAQSIRQHGILQPLIVRRDGERFEIIAGERRWRAAKLAGLKEAPVIVRELSDRDAAQVALIENIQREDLNPIEEAEGYSRLIDEFNLTQEAVAQKVGKSRSAVTNRLRLLKLVPEVRALLASGQISEGHARAVLSLDIPELQKNAAQTAVAEGLSVRETEKLVARMARPSPPKKHIQSGISAGAEDVIYKNLEDELRAVTGTKVEVQRRNASRGRIILEYYSVEELERLVEQFRKWNNN